MLKWVSEHLHFSVLVFVGLIFLVVMPLTIADLRSSWTILYAGVMAAVGIFIVWYIYYLREERYEVKHEKQRREESARFAAEYSLVQNPDLLETAEWVADDIARAYQEDPIHGKEFDFESGPEGLRSLYSHWRANHTDEDFSLGSEMRATVVQLLKNEHRLHADVVLMKGRIVRITLSQIFSLPELGNFINCRKHLVAELIAKGEICTPEYRLLLLRPKYEPVIELYPLAHCSGDLQLLDLLMTSNVASVPLGEPLKLPEYKQQTAEGYKYVFTTECVTWDHLVEAAENREVLLAATPQV